MKSEKTYQLKKSILILLLSLSLNLFGQSAEDYNEMGLKSDSLGKYQDAIKHFSKAIELAPEMGTAWYNRGGVRMKLKQYSLAVVDFNKSILLDNENWDAYFNRALAYRYTYNYQFALADIGIYISHYPDDYQAIAERSELAMEMSEWSVAEKDLKLLLPISDASYFIASKLITVYLKQKKYAEAESLVTSFITTSGDNSDYYYDRAMIRNNAGNYQGSLDDCNLVLLKSPDNFIAQALKADNYFFLKDFEQAESIYESLYKKDTSNADLMADYGHCLLQTNKFLVAEQLLTKSIRLKGQNLAYAYLGRGLARFNLNKGQEACSDWQRSLMLGESKADEYLHKYCTDTKQHNE